MGVGRTAGRSLQSEGDQAVPEARDPVEVGACNNRCAGEGPHVLLKGRPAPRTHLAHIGHSVDISPRTTFQGIQGSWDSLGGELWAQCSWPGHGPCQSRGSLHHIRPSTHRHVRSTPDSST